MITTKKYGHKVDVYAYAMILWQMLTARRLDHGFCGDDIGDVTPLQVAFKAAMEKIRPKIPPFCPDNLKKVIERAWSHDPNSRPEFEDIVDDLDK